MEQYFATIIEGVRDERSLILLLSLVEIDILTQSKFTDHEKNVIKKVLWKNYICNAILQK